MRIGVDLDNTLADYRRPLERLCAEHGLTGRHPDPKLLLRETLRARGVENEWTRLQGELYGPLMTEAELFAGATQTVSALRNAGFEVFIVSHRTKHPISGEKHDLHASARQWLGDQGLGGIDAFFEETKDAKVARIRGLACDVFIDDLPEILQHLGFPAKTRRILFDPGCSHDSMPGLEKAATWQEIEQQLTGR